ncbi:conserved hypothetical protein [Vibrio jasicida]|uniref:Uncharacterized protein n=1 Tax=Vibrio jasicida TaxID=766224 RepID=A0AAU9QER2_9VIBR|nr:conserved hypothetical protein [Vibrio jasicida]CAH1603314.1 conserved hypothetical protein [Vibrio jasicida]
MDSELIRLKKTGELVQPIGELHEQLEGYLVEVGLPVSNVVAPIQERKKVINALHEALEIIPLDKRQQSYYMSKFTVAISVGLFDGALNYLWNETIRALRDFVINFDLQYFYSVAEKVGARYKNLTKADEISLVSEYDLLEICRRIGILNDINYQRLSNVNYMRNHASAAHPNDSEIDGHEMIAWLSVCLKHAVTAKPDHSLIEIQKLLTNVRTAIIPSDDYALIGSELVKQPLERIDDFLWTIFGIFTHHKTSKDSKDNIIGIAPYVWNAASEDRKYEIGARFGTFRKNAEVDRKEASQQFLEVVNGLSYKDEDSLAGELIEKLENLFRSHNSSNNFYNEYPHARDIETSLPTNKIIPRATRGMWVKVVSICYIGNGLGYREGVDEQAVPYYKRFIESFTESEVVEFIKLLSDSEFVSALSMRKPDERIRKMVTFFKSKFTNAHIQKVLDLVISTPVGMVGKVSNTSDYKKTLEYLPHN